MQFAISRTRGILMLASIAFFLSAPVVSAHSTVSPSQVPTSKYETFTVSVPTERDVPTVRIRLLVPEMLDRVTPFVKPGWDIETVTDENENVTEIIWSGGAIPAHQKDVFQFTARTPDEAATLAWKVYQTYQGGELVGWDQDPNNPPEGEDSVSHPYSITEVVAPTFSDTTNTDEPDSGSSLPLALSTGAFLVAAAALGFAMRRKQN